MSENRINESIVTAGADAVVGGGRGEGGGVLLGDPKVQKEGKNVTRKTGRGGGLGARASEILPLHKGGGGGGGAGKVLAILERGGGGGVLG